MEVAARGRAGRFRPKEDPMQYMLLIYQNESARQTTSDKQMAEIMGAYTAYTAAMKESGAYVAGDRLRPSSTATTVRVANGRNQVLNGPYAETKEQLGGYYIIEVPDLDAALSWAARCPGAQHGVLEVRPIWPVG
jgi:hypothetical protein